MTQNLGKVVGDSAYEVAVSQGYVGTESEWLASLVGPAGSDGQDGVSAGFGQPTITVSTLPSGSAATASVTASGSDTAKIFNFNLGVPAGPAGSQGEAGFSPTASVSKTGSVATIVITDSTGTTTASIYDGSGATLVAGSGISINGNTISNTAPYSNSEVADYIGDTFSMRFEWQEDATGTLVETEPDSGIGVYTWSGSGEVFAHEYEGELRLYMPNSQESFLYGSKSVTTGSNVIVAFHYEDEDEHDYTVSQTYDNDRDWNVLSGQINAPATGSFVLQEQSITPLNEEFIPGSIARSDQIPEMPQPDGVTITSSDNVWSAVGGGGSSYTAGDGINITNDVISINDKVLRVINPTGNNEISQIGNWGANAKTEVAYCLNHGIPHVLAVGSNSALTYYYCIYSRVQNIFNQYAYYIERYNYQNRSRMLEVKFDADTVRAVSASFIPDLPATTSVNNGDILSTDSSGILSWVAPPTPDGTTITVSGNVWSAVGGGGSVTAPIVFETEHEAGEDYISACYSDDALGILYHTYDSELHNYTTTEYANMGAGGVTAGGNNGTMTTVTPGNIHNDYMPDEDNSYSADYGAADIGFHSDNSDDLTISRDDIDLNDGTKLGRLTLDAPMVKVNNLALEAPNGDLYMITVDNSGNLTATLWEDDTEPVEPDPEEEPVEE